MSREPSDAGCWLLPEATSVTAAGAIVAVPALGGGAEDHAAALAGAHARAR